MKQPKSLKDISKGDGPLAEIRSEYQVPLPPPFDDPNKEPPIPPLSEKAEGKVVLDDTIVLKIPIPKTPEEEEELVNTFLSGLAKLMTPENNWTFLQQTTMSMEHCAGCQTCNDACHIYLESGRNNLYRPTYRSEILRRPHSHRRGGSVTFAQRFGSVSNSKTITPP